MGRASDAKTAYEHRNRKVSLTNQQMTDRPTNIAGSRVMCIGQKRDLRKKFQIQHLANGHQSFKRIKQCRVINVNSVIRDKVISRKPKNCIQ